MQRLCNRKNCVFIFWSRVNACPKWTLNLEPLKGKCFVIKHHQTCLVTKHFTIWPHCLLLFDHVWSCLIKFEGHQAFNQTTENIPLVLMFDGRWFVCWDSHIKHVWHMHVYRTCSASLIHRYPFLFTYIACSVPVV